MNTVADNITIKMQGSEAMGSLVLTKSPDACMLYAYTVASGGKIDVKSAVKALEMPQERIEKAKNLLLLYGIVRDMSVAPARGESAYSPEEIIEAKNGDAAFRGLVRYAEAAMGKGLTKPQTEVLLGVYHSLNLPAEVIMLVINFCKMRENLSMREVEKYAYRWADEGINTYDEAERHLKKAQEMRGRANQMLRCMNIFDRKPSESEAKYLTRWADMGISDDLLRLGYDRTVLRTGKLEWKYMDRILQSWHEQGFKTRVQVETLDKMGTKPASKSTDAGSVIAFVSRIFEEKRKNREKEIEKRLGDLRRDSREFAENERLLRMCTGRIARAALSGKAEEIDAVRRENAKLLQLRGELLQALRLPENWLEDKPECSKCGDLGYVGSQMCDCFKLECRKEQDKRKGIKP